MLRVKGALSSRGARGNVYKELQRHHGYFSRAEEKQVVYENDDLLVKAYFRDESHARDFLNAIDNWEIHKYLVSLEGVEIYSLDPEPVPDPGDLTGYYLRYYNPLETESPCDTLDQLESYRLSAPITEGVEPQSPLAVYQALDVCVGTNKHYKCHLKSQTKYKSVASNPNNMLAASWPLHQMLDGLNNMDNMSVVKLSIYSASDEVDAQSFQAKPGATRDDTNANIWRTCVFVKDKGQFAEFVAFKGNETQRQWDRYNQVLRNM